MDAVNIIASAYVLGIARYSTHWIKQVYLNACNPVAPEDGFCYNLRAGLANLKYLK